MEARRKMNLLKYLALLGVGAGLVTLAETSGAQSHPVGQVNGLRLVPVSDAAVTAPVRNTYGRVKSIVGHELTLDAGGRHMTFIVDDNTDVLARGAGRATRKAGGSLPITDLVNVGDIARVSYRELDGAMRVLAIQIRGRNAVASR
jgi:hypothetical protein